MVTKKSDPTQGSLPYNKRLRPSGLFLGLAVAMAMLAVSFMLNVRFGFVTLGWIDVLGGIKGAINGTDASNTNEIVVRTARLPRACIAAAVGASLAMAGAAMQALTRNPLASPGILGINAGASLAVVAAIALFSIRSMEALMWVAFAGAAAAALVVYFIGMLGRDGLSPLKLVLAGASIGAFFSSLTQGILVRNDASLQDVLFWLAGSIAGRPFEMLLKVLPYMAAGWLATLMLSWSFNILGIGEDAARAVGMRVIPIKAIAGLAIVLMAGSAVAVAGPIGLIGIIVPHTARYFTGLDYRWLLPYSAVFGAVLLLLADTAARFIIFPMEVPVGIMTAALGAPFFIVLARRELRRS